MLIYYRSAKKKTKRADKNAYSERRIIKMARRYYQQKPSIPKKNSKKHRLLHTGYTQFTTTVIIACLVVGLGLMMVTAFAKTENENTKTVFAKTYSGTVTGSAVMLKIQTPEEPVIEPSAKPSQTPEITKTPESTKQPEPVATKKPKKDNEEKTVVTDSDEGTYVKPGKKVDIPEDTPKPTKKPSHKHDNSKNGKNTGVSGPMKHHLTRSGGVFAGPSGKETYYNLPMQGVVRIMRRAGYSESKYPYHIRKDGVKMLGPYIMVAANQKLRPLGTILPSSLGTAIVCDTGSFASSNPKQLDIAVSW